ncbi:hypothetical protein PLICRDRAFT_53265 [Plicaturopsis crispa FD-325 SS-3]|nr:hypothetical protein PLICRDRAFT_53265 [Plicaturopsis crispa FD-325 SS-3]
MFYADRDPIPTTSDATNAPFTSGGQSTENRITASDMLLTARRLAMVARSGARREVGKVAPANGPSHVAS